MESYSEKNAYVTIKGHNENFPKNIKCCLINLAISDMGKVSKQFLENIISKVQHVTNVNQWRNTSAVINWYTLINSNRRSRFLKFDIVEFYPSISEEFLSRAIEFAKSVTNIEINIIDIVKLSRKSLLFDESSAWVKTGNILFDVAMGFFDGADVCELVGLFLLESCPIYSVKLNRPIQRRRPRNSAKYKRPENEQALQATREKRCEFPTNFQLISYTEIISFPYFLVYKRNRN